MKRVGLLLKVKPDLIEEYKEHHRNVWPEMREALSRCGWHNYSLFMREDGLLFGYVETEDGLEAAVAKMDKEPINAKWQEMMGPFFEGIEGLPPDKAMFEIEEVFHLD